MTLAPLLAATPAIRLHALAALAAFGLGAVQLLARKGGAGHRARGWVWSGLMALVALSAFWIHTIRSWGGFSPLHGLAVVVLASLPLAIAHARAHRIAAHRRVMLALFTFALVVAGGFTLYPGRIMHAVLLGG